MKLLALSSQWSSHFGADPARAKASPLPPARPEAQGVSSNRDSQIFIETADREVNSDAQFYAWCVTVTWVAESMVGSRSAERPHVLWSPEARVLLRRRRVGGRRCKLSVDDRV